MSTLEYKKVKKNSYDHSSNKFLQSLIGKMVEVKGCLPLRGTLKWFDTYTICIENDLTKETVLLYKHGIDAIYAASEHMKIPKSE